MFGNKKNFNSITINGKTIHCSGSNIVINNGKVIVDGKVVQGDMNGDIRVEIHGDVESIKCGGSVTVRGNAANIDCGGGCEVCGDVHGNVDAGSHINCGNVAGNVDAGNYVNCGNVSGDVDAGGNVSFRRN